MKKIEKIKKVLFIFPGIGLLGSLATIFVMSVVFAICFVISAYVTWGFPEHVWHNNVKEFGWEGFRFLSVVGFILGYLVSFFVILADGTDDPWMH